MANPLKIFTALTASSGAEISGSSGLLVKGGDISGSNDLLIGGDITVGGVSTLQGVTATTVSASSTGQFGSDLTVAGTSTLQAVTASAVSASGAAQVGGALTVAGASALQGVTATTISASSTGQFGGDLTTAGDLTVGGNTIRAAGGTARLELSSGSADVVVLSGLTVGDDDGTAGSITLRNNHATMFSVDSSGNGHFDGDLTVGGTLSVETINYSSSSAITLGDKYIIIASGAADHASLDGSAILFGSGSGGYGTHAAITYRDSIDKLEITPGISSSAITGTELHIHGTGSQVLFNGDLTVDGTTTLAAVTASAVSASGAAQFGGALTVGGATALQGLTATTVSASSNAEVGGGLTVAGASALQGLTATTVSASSNGQFGGTLEVAGVSTLAAVTASAVSASGAAQVGGGLTVGGASALQGLTVTTVSASSNAEVGGTLTVGGISTLQAVTASSVSASGVFYGDGSGLININPANITNFSSSVVAAASAGGAGLTIEKYYDVRQAITGTLLYPYLDLNFLFSGSTVGGISPDITGSGILGLSASSESDLLEKISYASFDVAVKVDGSTSWTNDLVSLTVTAVSDGGNYYPKFSVSAPGLAANSKIRLIVVNEKADVIV